MGGAGCVLLLLLLLDTFDLLEDFCLLVKGSEAVVWLSVL
jgi:hypothetical protein